MVWFELVGINGAVFILSAYLLRKHPTLGVGTIGYQTLNLIGSVCLVIYGMQVNGIPIVIINTIWALDTSLHLIPNLVERFRPHSQIPTLWKQMVF